METKPKAIVFGVGNNYFAHKRLIDESFDVIGFVDNDFKKQGKSINGMKIDAPINLQYEMFDYILVTPELQAGYEIRRQLESIGIPHQKIRFISSGGVAPYRIDPLFFAQELTEFEKKRLFAENIERIVWEINSKCNRQCWFCTNSIVDRHSCNIDMSDKIFYKILSELKEINYDGDILLSYFNEPLCCTKIFDFIKAIREAIPKSFIYAFSNGDYLKKEHLNMLSEAGLDLLWVDIYTDDKSLEYDNAKVHSVTKALLERLDLENMVDSEVQGVDIRVKYDENMDIHFIARDFRPFASNRAESLPTHLPIPKISGHPLPCIKCFISFHIDYSGGVWPCPNYHCNFEGHKEYCLGNTLENSIFDIYFGEPMRAYRERHLFRRETLPCRSCVWNFYSFVINRFDREFRDRPKTRRDNGT